MRIAVKRHFGASVTRFGLWNRNVFEGCMHIGKSDVRSIGPCRCECFRTFVGFGVGLMDAARREVGEVWHTSLCGACR